MNIEELDAAGAELTAAIQAGVRDLVLAGLPTLLGLIGIWKLVQQRRRLRQARAELVAGADSAECWDLISPDEALSAAVFRIGAVLPGWARLEQDPIDGRWLILDVEAGGGDGLVGSKIVAVLAAPAWANACSDEELAAWAHDLGRRIKR